MFSNYESFKTRNHISQNLAVNPDSSINFDTLALIRKHNEDERNRREKYPTTLCEANFLIKQFIFDDFSVGGGRVS